MGLTSKNFYKKNYTIETSWDDGGAGDLKIAKLLKKYRVPGVFYIVVDWIGKDGFLTWEQVRLIRRMGFRIGSHTITHPQDLKKLHDEQLHYEIQNSKDMIEAVLGEKIDSFCYPRGRADNRVKRFVKEAGYTEARGTGRPGVIKVKDKFYLPGTIHVYQRKEYGDKSILGFAREMIDRVIKEGGYCNIWGHSKEVSHDRNFKILEEILKYASDKF
jgi:peptidoglycan/xylan/chitin deacetylase (PgdA/CDA1 family)